uniref:Uncharacterized protein n=1 Tax=Heterosigma akashiwo TaxID=2829 RepID=A0A6V1Q3J9_HETAK|mmetsp:Transcript_8685/g.15384  ORF Transcript_8685/g.15384 Transcript_8685/m.15384 type:complete len:574 (-) Transcript_8685:340-2061(-)|eukprot:CAMPEP_0194574324 /NCGR_PEP_ID=MMETSP0292-20121207/10226_1 /TAXON_ID=39354 /ORGANISM="Heterosigma akashiwo, Strain CCMP2393" /LENGTH=573 /DNA_ID=CAMNT_0039425833 /DNA_START=99 /DNA_END=1820 /DNA_ORIENTATION=-
MVKLSLVAMAVSAICLQQSSGFMVPSSNKINAIQGSSANWLRMAGESVDLDSLKDASVREVEEVVKSPPASELKGTSDEITEQVSGIEGKQEEKASTIQRSKALDELMEESIFSQNKGISRKTRIEDVKSQLSKSINLKKEAENAIAKEIGELKVKLDGELEEEKGLEIEIKMLISQLEENIAQKKELLAEEETLLVQLETVKTQVKEEQIFKQIDAASNVKADLIAIESVVIEDLEDCLSQMREELIDTESRIKTMTVAVSQLPAADDIDTARQYSWGEVSELNDLLVAAFDNLQKRDARIGALKQKFREATQQKALILGEVDVLGGGAGDGAKAAAAVAGGAGGKVGSPKKVVSVQISSDMTEQDILALAGDSSMKALGEGSRALGQVGTKLNYWAKSEDGQQSVSELIDAIEASKKVLPALQRAAAQVKKEWETEFKGEEMTTFDKLFDGIQRGIDAIKESTEVKAALDEAKGSFGAVGAKTGAATQRMTTALKSSTAEDATFMESFNAVVEEMQKTLIAVAAAGTKFVKNFQDPNRQLQSSKAPTEARAPTAPSAKVEEVAPAPKAEEK